MTDYDWRADAYGSYHAWINHKRAEYERNRIWLGTRWETAAETEARLATPEKTFRWGND